MVNVTSSMAGADLESSEGLGQHLIDELPDASHQIRSVRNSSWYPVAPPAARLRVMNGVVQDTMDYLLAPLEERPLTIHAVASNPEQKEDRARRKADAQIARLSDETVALQIQGTNQTPEQYRAFIWRKLYDAWMQD